MDLSIIVEVLADSGHVRAECPELELRAIAPNQGDAISTLLEQIHFVMARQVQDTKSAQRYTIMIDA